MTGQTISHYKILEKLGEGGMGIVYKAHDTKLNRDVALKLLPPHVAVSEADKIRFKQEAQAAATINHPNVCGIHSIGEYIQPGGSGTMLFIDMEYVDGVLLRELIASTQLSPNEVLTYALQIGEALEEAHSKGVTHRDIKPENIMVDRRNRIKVMDFGLAKLKGSLRLTKDYSTVGTVAYMAPEQIQGSDVDHRVDVFSFGVVLFEMLTGNLPFQGEHEAAMMYSILNEEPDTITHHIPDIHPGVIHILERALEKDRDDRYHTFDDLNAELRRVLKKSSKTITTPRFAVSSMKSYERKQELAVPPKQKMTVLGSIPIISIPLLGIILLVSLGYFVFFREPIPDIDRNFIAVLPFESPTDSPEDLQFVKGIHEDVINQLSKIGTLNVIARSSVIQYFHGDRNIRRIGEELGVCTVMEGTVWRTGDRIRVSVQLIDTETNKTIWADSFDKRLVDIFEFRSEIAQEIAAALRTSLTATDIRRLEQQPTDNTESYTFFMQAREYHSRPGYLKTNWDAAEKLYERAIQLDPRFALAYAYLSDIHASMYWFAHDRTRERIEKARECAERALFINPDLPHAHVAMGLYHYWGHRDYERALKQFNIAKQDIPNDPELFSNIASVQRRLGDWDSAMQNYNNAIRLDPKDPDHYQQQALLFIRTRNFEEALKMVDRQIDLAPDVPLLFTRGQIFLKWYGTVDSMQVLFTQDPGRIDSYRAMWWLTNCLLRDWNEALRAVTEGVESDWIFETQMFYLPISYFIGVSHEMNNKMNLAVAYYDTARVLMEKFRDERPDDARIRAGLGRIYAGLGRKDDAVREGILATELVPLERDALDGADYLAELAVIYTRTGEIEKTIKVLERLLSIPSGLTENELRIEPWWDPLREHPGFQKLVGHTSR